jgi:hypothetical protein
MFPRGGVMADSEKAHIFGETWIKPSSIVAVECGRFDFGQKLTIHLVSGMKLTDKLSRANASSVIALLDAFGLGEQAKYFKGVVAEERKSEAAKKRGSDQAQETKEKKPGKKG